MPFSDGIINFKDNFIQAWHDSAEPGQPGYIAPAMEQINDAGVTVGDGTTQFTAPTVFDYPAETDIPAMFRPPVYGPENNPNPTFNPSGLSYLNTMYPPVYDPQMSSGLEGLNAQPFTPQPHNPTIQSSQATDDISWAGGEGWSEEEFGGPGWTYGGGGSDTDGSLSYTFNGGGAGTYSAAAQSPEFILSQDLSQRTPSGTQYAPDLSAYNDSSLFNYAGPGGLSEYTYGQGLPTQGADYGIWGTPSDMVNPYYEGQFKPQGPADAAINMPAVELPEGVQPVSADVSMPGFTGSGNQIIGGSLPSGIIPRPPSSAGDLTYQQTIDEMGIFGPNNPPPSTTFPSPNSKLIEEQRLNEDAIKLGLAPPPIIDKGGVHYTGPLPPTAEQMRALSDINYGKTPYVSPGNPHPETLRTIDRQRLTYGKPLEMPIGDNLVGNEAWGQPGILSAFSENDEGMVDARRNYLFNRDLDLGRPGDASYEEFVADPSLFTTYEPPVETDYGVLAQAKADQLMANLTDQEIRDGLFLEPQLKIEDGEIVGKMGIPDIFTQDKTPIKPRDASLFDYNFEFDPDNPYLEQDITDGFLWQDNDGNYHRQWDDMGLVDIVPGMNDPEFLRGEALTESRKQTLAAEQAKQDKIAADANQARAEKAQREHEIYVREQLAARDAVLEAQAVAKAQAAKAAAEAQAQAEAQARAQAEAQAIAEAQAQAEAQARAQAAAQAEARTQAREQARQPVYTPKPAPVSRPSAPAGGYSTKSVNNNFATRRDIRNIFA